MCGSVNPAQRKGYFSLDNILPFITNVGTVILPLLTSLILAYFCPLQQISSHKLY